MVWFKRFVQGEESGEGVILGTEVFPRKGPWTANNNLGHQRLVADLGDPQSIPKYGLVTGQNVSIFKTNEWWFPHLWTLSLWITTPLIPDDGARGNTIARVDFGAGGAIQSVELDFITGTQISFPTNSINVAILQTPNAKSIVYAQAALGGRAGCDCPQRTIVTNEQSDNGTNGTIHEIPSFTSYVIVLPGVGSAINLINAGVVLQFSESSAFGSLVTEITMATVFNDFGGRVPIVGGATHVRVANNSGVDVTYSLIGSLNL